MAASAVDTGTASECTATAVAGKGTAYALPPFRGLAPGLAHGPSVPRVPRSQARRGHHAVALALTPARDPYWAASVSTARPGPSWLETAGDWREGATGLR